MGFPRTLVAGSTLEFSETIQDYPSNAGWTLRYNLVDGSNNYQITAAADGEGGYDVDVLPATTSTYVAGSYEIFGYVDNGTDRHFVCHSSLVVKPDPTSGTADYRSHAKKMLDAIDAVLLGRASKDQMSMTIEGRSIMRESRADLERSREKYAHAVWKEEKAKRGEGTRRHLDVKFT